MMGEERELSWVSSWDVVVSWSRHLFRAGLSL
jgi:hypothetical protein